MFHLNHWILGSPADLRQSIGESALLKLALETAQSVSTRTPRLRDSAVAGSNAQLLLALLTYCYASGIHGSREVESACRNDPLVRCICGNETPGWDAIWRFRNANRPWIEECLARVHAAAARAATEAAGHEAVFLAEFRGDVPVENIAVAQRILRRAVRTDASIYD